MNYYPVTSLSWFADDLCCLNWSLSLAADLVGPKEAEDQLTDQTEPE